VIGGCATGQTYDMWSAALLFVYVHHTSGTRKPTDLKDYNLSLAAFKRHLKSFFLTRPTL